MIEANTETHMTCALQHEKLLPKVKCIHAIKLRSNKPLASSGDNIQFEDKYCRIILLPIGYTKASKRFIGPAGGHVFTLHFVKPGSLASFFTY